MNIPRTITLALVTLLAGAILPGSPAATADSHCDYTVPGSLTIQAALNAATADQTVCITAGVHTGPLVLPNVDNLTVIGAGPGQTIIDADGQSTRGIDAEYSPSAWNSGLRLEGLSITGSAQYGLKLAWAENVALVNVRAIDNHRTGIDLNTVENVFLAGVTSDENGGNGIAIRNADQVFATFASTSGNAWGGLAFYAPGAESVTNVTISDSHFSDEGKAIYFQYDGYDAIDIRDNMFVNNVAGVFVEHHDTYGTPDASGILVTRNDFSGNQFGVVNTGSGTLDARQNYWGHPTGPLLGDAVHGDVEYTPWCVLKNCVV